MNLFIEQKKSRALGPQRLRKLTQ